MKTLIGFFLSLFVALNTLSGEDQSSSKAETRVYFSPKGGCTEALINEIEHSTKEVLMLVNAFDSESIAGALSKAAARGIKVRIISDKHKVEHSEQRHLLKNLMIAGVEVRLDGAHETAHNKVLIVDDKAVCTGSFNFTKQSEEENAENILVIRSPDIVHQYQENWQKHYDHSEIFSGKKPSKDQSRDREEE